MASDGGGGSASARAQAMFSLPTLDPPPREVQAKAKDLAAATEGFQKKPGTSVNPARLNGALPATARNYNIYTYRPEHEKARIIGHVKPRQAARRAANAGRSIEDDDDYSDNDRDDDGNGNNGSSVDRRSEDIHSAPQDAPEGRVLSAKSEPASTSTSWFRSRADPHDSSTRSSGGFASWFRRKEKRPAAAAAAASEAADDAIVDSLSRPSDAESREEGDAASRYATEPYPADDARSTSSVDRSEFFTMPHPRRTERAQPRSARARTAGVGDGTGSDLASLHGSTALSRSESGVSLASMNSSLVIVDHRDGRRDDGTLDRSLGLEFGPHGLVASPVAADAAAAPGLHSDDPMARIRAALVRSGNGDFVELFERERLDDSILVCAPDALERVLERAKIPLGVMTHILSAAAEATSLSSLSRPSGASLAFRRNDDDDASFVGFASVLDDGFDESVASIVTQSLIQERDEALDASLRLSEQREALIMEKITLQDEHYTLMIENDQLRRGMETLTLKLEELQDDLSRRNATVADYEDRIGTVKNESLLEMENALFKQQLNDQMKLIGDLQRQVATLRQTNAFYGDVPMIDAINETFVAPEEEFDPDPSWDRRAYARRAAAVARARQEAGTWDEFGGSGPSGSHRSRTDTEMDALAAVSAVAQSARGKSRWSVSGGGSGGGGLGGSGSFAGVESTRQPVEVKGKGRAGTQHDGHNPNRTPNKKKKKKKKKGFFSFGKASESASA